MIPAHNSEKLIHYSEKFMNGGSVQRKYWNIRWMMSNFAEGTSEIKSSTYFSFNSII